MGYAAIGTSIAMRMDALASFPKCQGTIMPMFVQWSHLQPATEANQSYSAGLVLGHVTVIASPVARSRT